MERRKTLHKSYILGSIPYLKGAKPSIKPPTFEVIANLSLGDFVELGFIEEENSATKIEFLFVRIEVMFPDKFIGVINTDVKKLKNVYFGELISFKKNQIVSVF